MQGEQARRLRICVDDFGLGAGVDQAVLRLARRGRISATSCMVGAPQWRADAPALRALDPAVLDVGLHLDLTAFPLDARLRLPLPHWLARSHLRLVPRSALHSEIEAQLDAFEQAMGRPPAHVDGHQHVHQLPVVRDELLAVLQARYGGRRPWLRRTRRPPAERGNSKAWLIEALGCTGLAGLAVRNGYRQNKHLLGVYDFKGGEERYLALLEAWLRTAQDGDLLMCHPATELLAGDAIAAARVWEYKVLAGPAFAALLAREAIQLEETMRP